MAKKLKVGQLVYVTPGSPYEDWNGLSGTVEGVNVGDGNRYIRVKPIIPMPDNHGGTMLWALFHPTEVKPENRPWLRKHLKDILKLKKKLIEVADFAATLE